MTAAEISLYGLREGTETARALLRASGCRTFTIEREPSGAIAGFTMSGHSRGLTCSKCRPRPTA